MKKLSASIDFNPKPGQPTGSPSPHCTSVLLRAAVKNVPILSGLWTFDIHLDGNALLPIGKWTVICEHTERGCDYLEIDLPLDDGYRLQRCLLIDHKDQLLLLGDTVLADEDSPVAGRLSYRAEFSVPPTLRGKTSSEATEIDFRPARPARVAPPARMPGRTAAAPAFRILPLALPEWHSATPAGEPAGKSASEPTSKPASDPAAGLVTGTFTETNGTLILQQESFGKSLFAPLLFDVNPLRLGKRYTWRQLSVGEDLRRVPEDQAVGYRIHLGQDQFLLYRSLTAQANRTVLGHNLIDDFCFARFDPETGVDPLIAVEVIG